MAVISHKVTVVPWRQHKILYAKKDPGACWITIFREVPQFGIYFGTYAWIRQKVSNVIGSPPEELGVPYLSLA